MISKIVKINEYEEVIKFADKTPYCTTYYNYDRLYKIEVNRFEKENISDVFDDKRVEEILDAQCGIFIDAQMGEGKTTFILKKVLPKLEKRGEKMLYLSSRVSLATSVKSEAAKYNEKAKEIFEGLNDKGLKNCRDFKVIDILTYQSFLSLSDEEIAQYGAVILDEVHFFIEDADFNRDTHRIYNSIMHKLRKICRIYITATPQDIFSIVYNTECEITKKTIRCDTIFTFMKLYSFKKDYCSYNLDFFKSNDELIELIENSDKKWLVFIDNIDIGEMLQDELSSRNIKTQLFEAKSKDDEKASEVAEFISSNNIKKKVLILTCAYDVGINVNNEDICIAMYTYTKTRFLQELGRKRLSCGEHVNVYVNIPSKKFIQNRYNNAQREKAILQNWIKDNQGMPVNGCEFKFPIYAVNGKYDYNDFTLRKYSIVLNEYERFLDFEDDLSFEDNFKKIINSWLGKEFINNTESLPNTESVLLSEDERKRLLEVIKINTNKKLTKKQADEIANQVLTIKDLRKDKRTTRTATPRSANITLNLLGYKLYKDSNKDYYTLSKEDNKNE